MRILLIPVQATSRLFITFPHPLFVGASPMAQWVKNPPAVQETQETWVQSLGWEDPLEEKMATHSSILAWRIPWTEEPDWLQSIGSQSQSRLSDLAHAFLICGSSFWPWGPWLQLRWQRILLQCRRPRFNLWVRKIPWRRKWLPTWVFLPGKSIDRGAWRARVHRAAKVEYDWVTDTHSVYTFVKLYHTLKVVSEYFFTITVSNFTKWNSDFLCSSSLHWVYNQIAFFFPSCSWLNSIYHIFFYP